MVVVWHLLLLLLPRLLFLLIGQLVHEVAPEVGQSVLVVHVDIVYESVGEVVHEIFEVAEVLSVDEVLEIKVGEGVVRSVGGGGGAVVGGRLFLGFLLHHRIL